MKWDRETSKQEELQEWILNGIIYCSDKKCATIWAHIQVNEKIFSVESAECPDKDIPGPCLAEPFTMLENWLSSWTMAMPSCINCDSALSIMVFKKASMGMIIPGIIKMKKTMTRNSIRNLIYAGNTTLIDKEYLLNKYTVRMDTLN